MSARRARRVERARRLIAWRVLVVVASAACAVGLSLGRGRSALPAVAERPSSPAPRINPPASEPERVAMRLAPPRLARVREPEVWSASVVGDDLVAFAASVRRARAGAR